MEHIKKIYKQSLLMLINQAYTIHKTNFSADIELCKLINVKTGGCPEDCGYCSQSIKYKTDVIPEPLMSIDKLQQEIDQAKAHGVNRICLGAAYKSPSERALDKVCEYVRLIKNSGLEACVTLGSLSMQQAEKLKEAGLDYYNHNIDTSPEYYDKVVTTRKFADRIATIDNVGKVGLRVCCGGILGLGESEEDRISFIHALTQLPFKPTSIPVNTLVAIAGTPLVHKIKTLDKLELVRVIATVRVVFPESRIRLSAGRSELSDLEQTLCFMAGANSIFYGDKLLTTPNNDKNADKELLKRIGVVA